MIQAMLTTIDNPYDPFDQYDRWRAYDLMRGHHTESFLARIVVNSGEQTLVDQHKNIEDAIDDIVKENITGLYKKVTREVNA